MLAVNPHTTMLDPRYTRCGSAHTRGSDRTPHLGCTADPLRGEYSELELDKRRRTKVASKTMSNAKANAGDKQGATHEKRKVREVYSALNYQFAPRKMGGKCSLRE